MQQHLLTVPLQSNIWVVKNHSLNGFFQIRNPPKKFHRSAFSVCVYYKSLQMALGGSQEVPARKVVSPSIAQIAQRWLKCSLGYFSLQFTVTSLEADCGPLPETEGILVFLHSV